MQLKYKLAYFVVGSVILVGLATLMKVVQAQTPFALRAKELNATVVGFCSHRWPRLDELGGRAFAKERHRRQGPHVRHIQARSASNGRNSHLEFVVAEDAGAPLALGCGVEETKPAQNSVCGIIGKINREGYSAEGNII